MVAGKVEKGTVIACGEGQTGKAGCAEGKEGPSLSLRKTWARPSAWIKVVVPVK